MEQARREQDYDIQCQNEGWYQLKEPQMWVDMNHTKKEVVLTIHTCAAAVPRAISQPSTLSPRKKLYTEPSPKCANAYFSSALDCHNENTDEKRSKCLKDVVCLKFLRGVCVC